MSQILVEEYEALVMEIGALYLDNMSSELGKKYNDKTHQPNAALSEFQHIELKKKHKVSERKYNDLYSEFQKIEPSRHLKKVMDAFTASGGTVDVEPVYDADARKLNVTINFLIKNEKLESLEGLSPMEEMVLKLNAMLQVENILSGSDPNTSPSF